MKRYSPELCNELMKEPETRIEKDFGIDGMIMAHLGEEIFRDPEYQEKKKSLKAREIRVRDLLETIEDSFRGEIWRVEVDGKNYANLSFDELNKKVNFWRIESYLEQRYYVQKLVIRTKGERKKVQETQAPQEIKAIPILYASSCWLRFPRD